MFGVPVDSSEGRGKLAKYEKEWTPAYELLSGLTPSQRDAYKGYIRTALYSDALPSTVVVRQDGTPVYADLGTPSLSEVREVIDRAESDASRERWAHASVVPVIAGPLDSFVGSLSRRALAAGGLGAGVALLGTIGLMIWRGRRARSSLST